MTFIYSILGILLVVLFAKGPGKPPKKRKVKAPPFRPGKRGGFPYKQICPHCGDEVGIICTKYSSKNCPNNRKP